MRKKQGRYSSDFKLAAVARIAGGESVSGLSRELGVVRACLYRWQLRYRLGGSAALRRRGRPEAVSGYELEVAGELSGSDLAGARHRIAALERQIGQQQVALDFFRRALRQVRATRPASGGPGGRASTRSSRR